MASPRVSLRHPNLILGSRADGRPVRLGVDDSVTGKPTDPRSMNRFLYAEGNPWSMVDPSGHGAYYEGEGCGAGSMYCGSTGFDQNAHNNASQVASTGNSHAHDQPHGPAWTPLATPTTETDRAADNPIFQTTIADRGQDNASLRSSPTCRFAGRAGCVPVGSGSGDASGLIIVGGVVIGTLVCIAGVCEAIAMAATGAAAAEGVIAGATAAASGACMVLCDKLMTVGAGINAGLGGSSAPQAAVAGGAARAEQFAANWPSASMTGTIDELLGTEVTVVSTASGKTIYSSASATLQVVADNSGGYFRVENTAAAGINRYVSQSGNAIPANVPLLGPGGTTMIGVPLDVRRALTHFLDEDPR